MNKIEQFRQAAQNALLHINMLIDDYKKSRLPAKGSFRSDQFYTVVSIVSHVIEEVQKLLGPFDGMVINDRGYEIHLINLAFGHLGIGGTRANTNWVREHMWKDGAESHGEGLADIIQNFERAKKDIDYLLSQLPPQTQQGAA